MTTHQTVSFDDEPLILVDADDQVTGYETKRVAHAGAGLLHRAFSIFLFADAGQVLLQQRSGEKPLWPLYWSNSCCSHPRRGETYEQATRRRLREELDIDVELSFLYRFEYRAAFEQVGAEHELCSVYVGKLPRPLGINVNPSEIAAWRWFDAAAVDRLIASGQEKITPWFKLEWSRLRDEFRDRIAALPASAPVPSHA